MQHSGTTGGAKKLKGDSGGEGEELDSLDSGGERGRLGVTIHNKGDLVLDDEDLVLGLNCDDLDDLKLGLSSDDFNNLELDGTSGDCSTSPIPAHCTINPQITERCQSERSG